MKTQPAHLARSAVFSMALMMALASPNALSAIDVYEFDSPTQEAQYRALIEELRCPKCQNQNLAGSDAQIAQDLKQKTYEMVKAGRTDNEIRQYMFERYGDFISYKPPIRPTTWILWYFPPILLLILLGAWIWHKKRPKNGGSPVKVATLSTESDRSNQGLNAEETAQLQALLAAHHAQDNKVLDLSKNSENSESSENSNDSEKFNDSEKLK